MTLETLLPYLLVLFVSGTLGYIGRLVFERLILKKAQDRADLIIAQAQKDIEAQKRDVLLEAKDQLIQGRKDFEIEVRDQRNEVQNLEKRILKKEESLERKLETIEQKEITVENKGNELTKKEEELKQKALEQIKRLEEIAGLSPAQAKDIIIKEVTYEAEVEAQKYLNKIEQETKATAEKEARLKIITAIQRLAPEISQDACVSSVTLPNAEMKGRIIGREGRNIRALEVLTGVDIIIDDTPEAIVLSCFDPVRREKARGAIEKLIADGRIHPARIEEVVSKVSQEVDKIIQDEGEKACFDLEIRGMHPELQKYVGRLKYRYSYGQNILVHSREVAQICGFIAAETGANVRECIRGGLLHDVGKGVHTEEGDHATVGAQIAKKYGESDVIVNAIGAHHFDVEPKTPEALIVQTGDAISASRPGARRESFNNYIKRLTHLEAIAYGFAGVEKAFAIQAGRELRIIVNNEALDDIQAKKTAKDIATRIENEMKYPGQVKVALIRETRVIEYAK
ncbi:MAG: ribonuclease Y [bacterium]|nr:MAG: ribonuclease Y [bacterium]